LDWNPRDQYNLELLQCDAWAIIAYQPLPLGTVLKYPPIPVDTIKIRSGTKVRSSVQFADTDTVVTRLPVITVNGDTSMAAKYRLAADMRGQEEHLDSLLRSMGLGAVVDSINAANPLPKPYIAPVTHWRYVGAGIALGLVIGAVDRDHGGYKDDLIPKVDKLAHGFGSQICAKWVGDRINRAWAFVSCGAMGAAIEYGQSRNGGYASWKYDLPYDLVGSAIGALWGKGGR
jgi:hypothetical protein